MDCTGSCGREGVLKTYCQFLVICYDENRIARILYRNTCVCRYLIHIYIYIKIYTSQHIYIYTHIRITFHIYIHQNRVKYSERMIFSTKHVDMEIVTVIWRFIPLGIFFRRFIAQLYTAQLHWMATYSPGILATYEDSKMILQVYSSLQNPWRVHPLFP